MSNLPSNWDGSASRALRALARRALDWAKENPEEWYNYRFEAGVRYLPSMRSPTGTVGTYEIYGKLQSLGPQSWYRGRKDAESTLFEAWTTELRSSNNKYQIVETLKYDHEADLF
jgi:hypothetical protein